MHGDVPASIRNFTYLLDPRSRYLPNVLEHQQISMKDQR